VVTPRVRALLAALLLALPAAAAWADPPPPGIVNLPFARTLDLTKVRAAVRSPPAQLLATITSLGIDVLRVADPLADGAVNPLLAGLPLAPPEVLAAAEFRNSFEGRVLLRHARCCGLMRDTILIRETASTWTLLHEFVHVLLPPSQRVASGDDIELAFASAYRRLWLYHCRL
jgi:hypothetical protein